MEHALKDSNGGLRVLLTGGTGFLGQEIIAQAVTNPLIDEMVVLIRPKTITDRKTGELIRVISPAERGANLLSRLGITAMADRERFRFVAGDIEKEYFGIEPSELEQYCEKVFYYPRNMHITKHLFSKNPFLIESRYSDILIKNLKNLNYPIFFDGLQSVAVAFHLDLYKRKKQYSSNYANCYE